MRRYLASWGYTPQRPIRRAYEQDNEAVKTQVKIYIITQIITDKQESRICLTQGKRVARMGNASISTYEHGEQYSHLSPGHQCHIA